MDIITGNVGWIEVICGPMFSGKSEELIRLALRLGQFEDRLTANRGVSHPNAPPDRDVENHVLTKTLSE